MNPLKVIKPAIYATAFCGAAAVNAATVAGFSDVMDNGDGTYTFYFDTLPSDPGDIIETGDGITFDGAGVTITATSGEGNVIQDYPADGGLGVISSNGPSDNLETAIGETLLLSFSTSVEIVKWTFNGLVGQSGHQDAADGNFIATASNSDGVGGAAGDASLWDGVGDEFIPDEYTSICEYVAGFCDTTSILFQKSDRDPSLEGYLESITIRVATVPVPASFGFLLAGIAGFGAVARKRRNKS